MADGREGRPGWQRFTVRWTRWLKHASTGARSGRRLSAILFFVLFVPLPLYYYAQRRPPAFAAPAAVDRCRSRFTAPITVLSTLPRDLSYDNATCSASGRIQRAVRSWLAFAAEVVLVSDEVQACERHLRPLSPRVLCVAHMCTSAIELPTVKCLIATGAAAAATATSPTDLLLYVNNDVELHGPVSEVAYALTQLAPSFVAFGQRFDHDDDNSQGVCARHGPLRERVELHAAWGVDYFLFRGGDFPHTAMPEFVIGNWRWDNWLARYFIEKKDTLTVDVTAAVLAWHPRAAAFQPASRRIGAQHNDGLGRDSFATDYRQTGTVDRSEAVLHVYDDALVLCDRARAAVPAPLPCRWWRRRCASDASPTAPVD